MVARCRILRFCFQEQQGVPGVFVRLVEIWPRTVLEGLEFVCVQENGVEKAWVETWVALTTIVFTIAGLW